MAESRGKKRAPDEDHEEHENHEAWVIPYADMLTLLMALFLVMWALGQSDAGKVTAAAESFRREFGGSSPIEFDGAEGGALGLFAAGGLSIVDLGGGAPLTDDDPRTEGGLTDDDDPFGQDGDELGADPIDGGGDDTDGDTTSTSSTTTVPPGDDTGDASDDADPTDDGGLDQADGDGGYAAEQRALDGVQELISERLAEYGLTDSIGFRREDRGLVVTVLTDQVLFGAGDASVDTSGGTILDIVAEALRDLDNQIAIEGHTDDRPISTARFPSNWELSTARATSVLRYLVEDLGFPADRISASGYADTRPIDPAQTDEARAKNRRVEIVVLSTIRQD